ncbi:hypothetical protein HMPREF9418_2351 [Neisseria macacae ATCC 33926]|uniref:Uncharacterized protein n=1 Tax=Neisseria macacae ATCC 33926 TaxID=997348 RepID=A0AA36UHF9_9NEIS|nr:hypothetical protein HMPREF9418_2351 [Neisseria macacae ATCC 33926]
MIHYSGLTLNRYGVASPCSDLNLIHYKRYPYTKRSSENLRTDFSDDLWCLNGIKRKMI